MFSLPDPRLTPVYRLQATLGQPLDLGAIAQGRRRIVPLTGGSFSGPELHGTLVPGNKGIFISVAGRQPGGVIYETYLVA